MSEPPRAHEGTRAARPTEAHSAIQAVWRIEAARLIAGIARLVRDVGVAEELAQDALVAALESWPKSGIPEKPGAWLMLTARRRAIDHLRRQALQRRSNPALAVEIENHLSAASPDVEAMIDRPIEDDVLRLAFIACHPVLSMEARVALTLRLLGGLTTQEIARAFLVTDATIQQRIVRAKRTLSEAEIPFELPPAGELGDRMASVLRVIYLVFNEGYAASSGDRWMRPELCEEAMRLARVLATLAPEEKEVHGLAALLEIQGSRLPARAGDKGEPVLLLDQDRTRWDRLLIRRGLTSLDRALAIGGPPGSYTLQAAIAACHARASAPEDTDWIRIAALYDALMAIEPSPVVDLNRAVAIAMAYGPAAGLDLVDALADEPSLANYHLLPAVRGDLLSKLGRENEAALEFARAASLAGNARERALMLDRAAALTPKA